MRVWLHNQTPPLLSLGSLGFFTSIYSLGSISIPLLQYRSKIRIPGLNLDCRAGSPQGTAPPGLSSLQYRFNLDSIKVYRG
jgi:hypothetical protein